MCWNKLIWGGDSGTAWASAQHTPGSTHAIPDGTEGRDDSSPLPHPPKPKLGPGSGPRVGPAPEGDSFQPPAFLPELCRRMMLPIGQQTQLKSSTSRNPEHEGIFVSVHTKSFHCSSACQDPMHYSLTTLSTWLKPGNRPQHRKPDTVINGLYPLFKD